MLFPLHHRGRREIFLNTKLRKSSSYNPINMGVGGARAMGKNLRLISGDVYGNPIGVICDTAKNRRTLKYNI